MINNKNKNIQINSLAALRGETMGFGMMPSTYFPELSPSTATLDDRCRSPLATRKTHLKLGFMWALVRRFRGWRRELSVSARTT